MFDSPELIFLSVTSIKNFDMQVSRHLDAFSLLESGIILAALSNRRWQKCSIIANCKFYWGSVNFSLSLQFVSSYGAWSEVAKYQEAASRGPYSTIE